jgi:sigma-B regulation protein RsbU (phosphoserine phosphatase)
MYGHRPLPTLAPFSLVLPPSNLAPRIARRTLGRWLGEMSCPPELIDDATLVIDELMNNVVQHAATTARVVASVDDGRLRHEVHDRSGVPLRFELAEGSGCSGLRLVAMLVDDWGWAPLGGGGKYVWAEMRFANPSIVTEPDGV